MNIRDKSNWQNADNSDFFEQVPIELFRGFVTIGGFDNNCDLRYIYPTIKDSHNLLEVGAGYGRVIDFLLKEQYEGSITAIERSKHFCHHIRETYPCDNKIKLIHTDIEMVHFNSEFDAILFLWSGLSDWPPEDHFRIIEKLFSWVAPDGYLIIELFDPSQAPLNSTACEQQFYQYESEYGTFKGYTPNQGEMAHYVSLLNVKSFRVLPYITTTNRKRTLYILRK